MVNPQRIEQYIMRIAINNPELLPDCMLKRDFECTHCQIYEPETCLIRLDWEFRSLLRFRLSNSSFFTGIEGEKEERIIDAIVATMSGHGRPLHLDKIYRMLLDRYPELDFNRNLIGIIIARNTHVFEKVSPAVYTLKQRDKRK